MRMRYIIALSGAAFITFGYATAASASAGLSEDAKAFLAAARSNFAAWDTSHKGRLTLAEIEADMQNPAIKGDGAAALAALMWGARPTKAEPEPRSYVLADFDAIEQDPDGREEARPRLCRRLRRGPTQNRRRAPRIIRRQGAASRRHPAAEGFRLLLQFGGRRARQGEAATHRQDDP